jgi:class 3 adenylate cyclase/tetratricopeptide (TPR) repeat protein
MHCPLCRHENRQEARFCEACGSALARTCPVCGNLARPQAAFCDHCGTPLTGQTPAPTSSALAPRPQTPQVYTPTHLAEMILTSRSGLEGERKQVTVLFADLKASLELLADRDPEEARQILDSVVERMIAAVHRYEGTVNQVMGDGIMALFGAPIAHEDHAVRACYAALRMQESVKQYAEDAQRSQGVSIHIRVGLNSGEVVVRAIGSDLRMDYSAIGQTTHLAARMEQLAPPGSIWLTAETLRLAEGMIQVDALGPVSVKGLSQPVAVFELLGADPTRRHLQSVAARGLTRFVGRQTELKALQEALERAGTGHGQIVAAIGEPGLGKSRLFYEFIASPLTQDWLILETGGVSYGQVNPYLPIRDLLKAYFQIDDRDDESKIREKVDKRLIMDVALRPTLPALLALLDVTVDDPAWQALDPSQRRLRTIDGIKRLLLRHSQVQPLLLIVENLHWIDAGTQAFLDSLIESMPTARLLLLVNYRPEYQHRWGSKTYYTQLRLDPLPAQTAEEILQALLGDAAELQPVRQLLIERTEGNPFFLEESIRTLVETQVLVGERGAYRPAKAPLSIQVPATVQAILAARIDRLPPEEKYLLQCAAVIGKDASLTLLQAIAELTEDNLHLGLAHLQTAEFLYETSLFPELAYTFKHALTQEVAYGGLLQERRRALHARIVDAIETLYADRLATQVAHLAHHAFRGERWEKALVYCRQAGIKAAMRSAHQEAVGCFEQALVALQHLPENQNTREQAIDLRFSLRNALLALGEHRRTFDHLRTAETLAEALNDQRRLGRTYAYLTEYFRLTGELDRAVESGERALALATALADFTLQVMATFFLGIAYYDLGDHRRAVDCFSRNVASLAGDLIRERFGMTGLPSVMARTWLVACLADVGEFNKGAAMGEEAVRIAESVDSPFSLTQAYLGLGSLYLRKGDLHKAIPMLERSLGLCQVANILTWFPTVAAALGYAYTLSGRVAEALPLLKQAVEQETSRGLSAGHARRVAYLSEAYLLAGRMDEARDLAGRALEFARAFKARGYEAYALWLLGEVHSHQDPLEVEAAETAYRQAFAIAEEVGMRSLLARGHLGLGILYTKIGQPAQARAELSAAIELFHAMEMTFWLPRAEAALARVIELELTERRAN